MASTCAIPRGVVCGVTAGSQLGMGVKSYRPWTFRADPLNNQVIDYKQFMDVLSEGELC